MLSTSLAGLHLKVYVNGALLGLVTAVPQLSIDTDYRDAREIDSNVPRELIPGQYRVNISLQVLRGRDSGGLEGLGLAASAQNMLLQKLSTVEIIDRVTSRTVYKLTGCQVTRQSWAISSKQLVVGTVSIIGTTSDTQAQF